MKLKKGSLEAKLFMAKIRAKKGKPKKVSGIKKTLRKKTPTKKHTDINSHNYKISISGMKSDVFNKLEDLNKKIDRYNEMIKFYSSIKNTKGLDTTDKKHYKYMANISKKHLKSFKEQINSLKKLI